MTEAECRTVLGCIADGDRERSHRVMWGATLRELAEWAADRDQCVCHGPLVMRSGRHRPDCRWAGRAAHEREMAER